MLVLILSFIVSLITGIIVHHSGTILPVKVIILAVFTSTIFGWIGYWIGRLVKRFWGWVYDNVFIMFDDVSTMVYFKWMFAAGFVVTGFGGGIVSAWALIYYGFKAINGMPI